MSDDAPDMTAEFDGRLYHATTRAKADAALRDGIPAHRAFWGVLAIAEYYFEVLEEDGEDGALLSAPLDAFRHDLLSEDAPGFEEPITTVVGTTEKAVHAAWKRSRNSWRESLDLIGSVAYDGEIAASQLRSE